MNYENLADSLETSVEIIEAIGYITDDDEQDMMAIWESPSVEELRAIWERVTGNGLKDSTDYFWGEQGSNWYA